MAGNSLLVIAQSGRALATAAAAAGYTPFVIDFFGDEDTCAVARDVFVVPGGLRCGFARRRLETAVAGMVEAAGDGLVGAVLGSGFEDRPRLITAIDRLVPVMGTPAKGVAAVKDPMVLAAAAAAYGIPTPAVSLSSQGAGWLVRRRGGAGGTHIRPDDGGPLPTRHFVQQRVDGTALSVTAVGNGEGAVVIAFTAQWPDPAPGIPFRFGGIAGPALPPARHATEIRTAADRLAAHFGLRGLFSLDLMIDDDRWWLLEVNPRPGAAIDVLRTEPPLIELHLAGAGGALPPRLALDATIRAWQVVYAGEAPLVLSKEPLPAHVSDRPAAGLAIGAGEPVASVRAEAESIDAARAIADERALELLATFTGKGGT